MANQTTGLGVPTKVLVPGNLITTRTAPPTVVDLSLTGSNGYPTTFQLDPNLEDAGGNEIAAGTALVLTAVAAASVDVLTLSAVASSGGGVAVYTGTITPGAANALVGYDFIVAGFQNGANDGTFRCSASSTTTLTLVNANAVAETHAATATSEQGVAVYTGTITGGASNALAGQTFNVAGFTNAGNNGEGIATASSATTLTLAIPDTVAETHAATATSEETTLAITYVSYNPAYATVSATGLLTAVKQGETVVEVSYPTFANASGVTGAATGNPMHNLPLNKIYREVNVHVKA